MKKKVIAASLLLASLGLFGFTYRQPPRAFEYKEICTVKTPKKPDADLADINAAGAEGWEMAGTATLFDSVSCVYLKRPKP